MNRFFTLLLAASCLTAVGQCDADYDFGDALFGIASEGTNSLLSDSLESAVVGSPYHSIFHLKTPQFVLDVDPTLPFFPDTPLDSAHLSSIRLVDFNDTLSTTTLEAAGLAVTCNNNGDSGNPCSFLGASQYCGTITGVPEIDGSYRLDFYVSSWVTVFGFPFSQESLWGSSYLTVIDECIDGFDVLGVCGGSCSADADADGICDDVDDCVGALDACGVCNGPGEIYDCGCADIPVGDCDCAGNVLDECGVCGGIGIQEGSCDCEGNVLDVIGVCGGDCISDVNNNGICDLEELENVSGEEFCGQGTIWDEATQFCLPLANPSDLNLDGCVDVQDFMGHLAAFGEGCNGNPQTSLWQCGDPVSYQGYDYETVQIGEQCWFAENLRAENYRNGDAIPYGLDADAWATTMEGARAIFDNDPSWLGSYGQLYNLHAVMDVRGICPAGWHVPDAIEFDPLAQTLGGYDVAGEALKSSAQDTPSWNGTNTSGFNGLPAGYRDMFGEFDMLGVVLQMWTNTPYSCGGRNKKLETPYQFLNTHHGCLNHGSSVRCIKDSE